MQEVRAWRLEANPVVSEATRRLLRWMEAVTPSGSDIEEIGRSIAGGLAEAVGAHSVLVLAHPVGRDELWPLAWLCGADASTSGEGTTFAFENTAPAADNRVRIATAKTLDSLPQGIQWHEDTALPLQILIGHIIEAARAHTLVSSALPVATPMAAATTDEPFLENVAIENDPSARLPEAPPIGHAPSLIVPFFADSSASDDEARGAQSSEALRGVALLWMQSDDGMAAVELESFVEAAARQAGGWLGQGLQLERMARSYRDLAVICAGAIDGRDARRSGHSRAVAHYSALMAWSLGLSETESQRIEFAGLLHDIGKVSVPDAILQKTAPLELNEIEAVRAATQVGASWIESVEGLREVAAIVRHQAERFDGGGYPDGLSGEQIPLGSRVLAVALRFAAMTKPRADRGALSVVGGAFEALSAEAGRALDPLVVQAFRRAMGRPRA